MGADKRFTLGRTNDDIPRPLWRNSAAQLGKAGNLHRAFNSKTLAMEFDSLNFVKCFCCEVALPTIGTTHYGDVLYH